MSLMTYNERYRGLPAMMLASLDSDQPGQSMLFSGDSIVELLEFLEEWIKTLVCEQRIPSGSCGVCRHCGLINSGNYPELYRLEPSSKSRTILTGDLKAFQNRFYYKGQASLKKIGIIVDADRMQVAAQNAFLKTLEEPPPHTIFILVTTRADLLLNTIKSRCRTISLNRNRVSYDPEISEALKESLCSLHGKDGASVALKTCDQVKILVGSLKKKALEEISAIEEELQSNEDDNSGRKKQQERIINLTEGRYRLYREQVISMIEVWLSQNYLLATGVGLDALPHSDWVSASWQLDPTETELALNCLEQFRRDLNGNVNEELAMENFFLQISQK
jgi:DNA polymerase III subunit delta'